MSNKNINLDSLSNWEEKLSQTPLWIFVVLFIVIVVIWFFWPENPFRDKNKEEEQSITIPTELPPLINNLETTKTEEEKFSYMVDSWIFVKQFTPKRQPKLSSSWYTDNTEKLNSFLEKNNQLFDSKKIWEGYLYIKLTAPLVGRDIFLYFHAVKENWYPVSGNLVIEKNLLDSNDEFLYKLSDIPLIRYYSKKEEKFDWLKHLNSTNNSHFIGGYTTMQDGTSIGTIIITGI